MCNIIILLFTFSSFILYNISFLAVRRPNKKCPYPVENGGTGDPWTQPRSMFCPHLTPHSPPVMHRTQWSSPGGNPGLMQPCMGTVAYCAAFDGSF